jgi:hypothetical protein
MNSLVLLDPQVRDALKTLAASAPGGFRGLDTLGDHKLMLILTHADAVKVVEPFVYLIDLPEVDQQGYVVYDETFTESHRVVVDVSNPTDDLNTPHTRTMRFGRALLDMAFMLQRSHGDIFYIGYDSLLKPPRVVMVAVIDPTQL